jgi:hypothetical protein
MNNNSARTAEMCLSLYPTDYLIRREKVASCILVPSAEGYNCLSLPGRQLHSTLHTKLKCFIVSLCSEIRKVFMSLDPNFYPDTNKRRD